MGGEEGGREARREGRRKEIFKNLKPIKMRQNCRFESGAHRALKVTPGIGMRGRVWILTDSI